MSLLQRLRPDHPGAFDFWCGFMVGLCVSPVLLFAVPALVLWLERVLS